MWPKLLKIIGIALGGLGLTLAGDALITKAGVMIGKEFGNGEKDTDENEK